EAAGLNSYGDADIKMTGGSEASVSPLHIRGFGSKRVLSRRDDDEQTASRPWAIDRDGCVDGEGAVVLLLEEYEHAKKRGAHIFGKIIGDGMSSDAHHITMPDSDGSRRGMVNTLRDAGLNPEQVDYINAHGTSTPLGDIN